MTTFIVYAATGIALFVIGLHALITRPHLVRKVLALNVMGNGIFLVLIGTSARSTADAPPDPVPHAMVLTGIVVAVSATAFALALARRIHRETGSSTLDEARPG